MSNYRYIAFITIVICILIYVAVMFCKNMNYANMNYTNMNYTNMIQEGFSQYNDHLSSGEYPLAADKPILYGDYNVKTPPSLSAFNASDIYKDYPVFPAHSLENNRIRYWSKPENGTCSRAELCGYFYDEYTPQNIPGPPPVPGWNKRVNFYVEDY
jgi:hypothetical protein